MAKTKVTKKANDSKQENPQDQNIQNQTEEKNLTHKLTMEDASEKIQNLKSLNSMLLKETLERRQQVESLNQAKEALESELSRFSVEKSELLAHLSGESERSVSLEIEKGLFCVFVRTQMIEIGLELDKGNSESENEIRALRNEVDKLMVDLENERRRVSHACIDRDSLKCLNDRQAMEAHELKQRLTVMEKKENDFEHEILVLKKEYGRLMEEKHERDTDFEAVKEEKGFVERRLVETVKEVDGLKGRIEEIVRVKKEIEMEKSGQKLKIRELEKEVEKLNEIVLEFQKEEKLLHEKFLELEKRYSEATDKEKEMALAINALLGQKREKQSNIERLIEEKGEISLRFETAIADLKDKEGQIEKLLHEKNEIEEKKVSQEAEIVVLKKEIGKLRDLVFTLKESNRDQEEKNNRLINEVRDYKNALDQVMLEKDDAKKGLDEEKKHGMELQSKVTEMGKRIEENVQELAKIRNERENLIEEKKSMQSHIGLLMEEKELVHKNLLEAKQDADDLRVKMESVGLNSNRALSMLRKTAAIVCQSKDDLDGKEKVMANDKKLEDKTETYVAELEAIENAFRNKEKVVEDMKRQVESMQNSVAEAQKKKSFLTLLSSATTIFAAASVAYAARIR